MAYLFGIKVDFSALPCPQIEIEAKMEDSSADMIPNMVTWKAWELSVILPFTNKAQKDLNIAVLIEIT